MQGNTGYPTRLRVLSLFAGIGGIDLGVERAGMEVVAHSELEPYACKVLARHWPEVPNLGDITTIDWSECPPVDVIAGGFPCQDISLAGKGAGIKEGTRSGLWSFYADGVRELRPRYVIVENVSALAARGLDRVLGDMAALGYDAWWDCVPAAAVGAPHRRDRLFIVATRADVDPFHTDTPPMHWAQVERSEPHGDPAFTGADAHGDRRGEQPARISGAEQGMELERGHDPARLRGSDERRATDSDPEGERRGAGRQGRPAGDRAGEAERAFGSGATADTGSIEHEGDGTTERGPGAEGVCRRPVDQWRAEPGVGRVAPRVPNRVDRLRCLGNAVVPQVAQYIGELVVAHHAAHSVEEVA